MAAVIRFQTDLFDVSHERVNPINPIHGESLLLWLASKLRPRFEVTEPDAEDWSWHCNLDFEGMKYMLGSSASDEDRGQREWVLQIVLQRSFKQRLLGQRRAIAGAPCVQHLLALLQSEPKLSNVTLEGEA